MFKLFESMTDEERLVLAHGAMNKLKTILTESAINRIRTVIIKTDEGVFEVSDQPGRKTSFHRSDIVDSNLNSEDAYFLASLAHYKSYEEKDKGKISHPSFGAMNVVQRQGLSDIFDHPIQEQNVMNLSLYEAQVDVNPRFSDMGNSIDSEKNLWEVNLSSDQYARLVRSDCTEVACTIGRRCGYLIDSEPQSHMMKSLDSKHTESESSACVEALQSELKAIQQMLLGSKRTSIKGLKEIHQRLVDFRATYERHAKQIEQSQKRAIEEIQSDAQNRLADEVNKAKENARIENQGAKQWTIGN